MKIREFGCVAMVVLAMACPYALGTVFVSQKTGIGVQKSFNAVTQKWEIVLLAENVTFETVDIWGSANDDIAFIRIIKDGPGSLFLDVGDLGGSPSLDDVDEISLVGGDAQRNCVLARLDINGDVGDISVNAIVEGTVRGSVVGDIVLLPPDNGGGGDFLDFVVEGDLLGNIYVPVGVLGDESIAVAGSIGQIGSPIQIATRDGIGTLSAGEINANIDTTDFGINSTIREIRIESINNSSGDFNGSIVAKSIEDSAGAGIIVDGDFDGEIDFSDALSTGREIRIGGSLTSSSSITLPAAGLAGQIVINNNDDGGTWDGEVNVDTVVLDDPNYAEAAATLGGGSVGLAPFSLHDESCDPFNTGMVIFDTSLTALVRLYGPVTFSSSPLTVGRRVARTSDSFTDVTSDFEFSAVTGDANSILVSKSASGAGFEVGYEYLIEPTSSTDVRRRGR